MGKAFRDAERTIASSSSPVRGMTSSRTRVRLSCEWTSLTQISARRCAKAWGTSAKSAVVRINSRRVSIRPELNFVGQISARQITAVRTACGREATAPKANHFSRVELENDFAASFALSSVRHRRLRVINRICLLDFRFQKAAPGHVEERLKCFHSLLHRRVVVRSEEHTSELQSPMYL